MRDISTVRSVGKQWVERGGVVTVYSLCRWLGPFMKKGIEEAGPRFYRALMGVVK